MIDADAGVPDADIKLHIQQLNFLAGVSTAEAVELLANSVQEVYLYDRQVLCEQDQPIHAVWLILEGRISQFRRQQDAQGKPRQSLARECGPGTLIGAYDFLFTTTYRTRASALETCRLLKIEARALSRLIFRFPNVREQLAPLGLIGRLRTFPLLGAVELVGLGFLADALTGAEHKEGEVLYHKGDSVDQIYLLSQGQVELRWNRENIDWVGNGTFLGLAHHAGGAPVVNVEHDCIVSIKAEIYAAPRSTFMSITGLRPDDSGLELIAQRIELIRGLSIFSKFKAVQKQQLAGFFSHNCYPANHLLIQQNEAADSFWVLMPGSGAIIHALDKDGRNMPDTPVTGMTYFAETALLGQIPQDSTVEAEAGSQWLRLHWHDFYYMDEVDPADLRAELQIPSVVQPVLMGKEARRRYPWLQPGETVAYFSRRHWIAFIIKNFLTLIFMGLVVVFGIVGYAMPGQQIWVIFMVIVLLLLATLALIWGILDYRNDWLVVTNRRVVNQEKLLFVHVWRKEAPLEQIQSIDFIRTFIGRWLGYGTLIVRTAGTAGEIAFNFTTDFTRLRTVIRGQQEQRRRHATAQSKMNIHRRLEQRLGLMVDPPSRVARAEPPPSLQPQGWRSRLAGREGLGIRWQEGNHIVWRKHWMALLPQIGWTWLAPFFIITLALGSWAIYTRLVPTDFEAAAYGVQWFLALFALLFTGRLIWVVIDWYNDTYEVSDTEVVNLRKLPFGLTEDRRAAPLARIQNVEMRIPSPLHWLFDYGTVVIQTAAEFGSLIFYSVPNPRAVADEILGRMEKERKRQEEEEARQRAQDLPDWFEMYNRLEQGGAGERVKNNSPAKT